MKKTVLTTSLLVAGASMTMSAFAGVDPLTQVKPVEAGWGLNGAPDYIVDVPAAQIPATGVLDYVNTNVDLPFTEEKWVKSVQFIPGDKRVLHHLLSYVVASDHTEAFDEADNDDRSEFLEGFAPGKEDPTTYPAGTGVKVPVGSALRMSIHYTAMGQETEDATRVGLWFADKDEAESLKAFHTYSVSAQGGRENNIIIPPGDMNYEMASNHVFDQETTLYSFRAHMHYRGKSMRASVIYPDQTREEIINVANYNFAWQPTYRLSEPMVLPAGSRVVVEGAFDNSQYNVGNPDPSVAAVGGLQSWDEMFIGYFSYTDN
ncbi:MAG: hypothetical protein H7A05_11340 [Pseudomonadales bacterium]|nr:hypothetical protein [Pseudomonadales bacterium]MCP5345205.1 hypothetical protein [Pseudomonadales bacterium]